MQVDFVLKLTSKLIPQLLNFYLFAGNLKSVPLLITFIADHLQVATQSFEESCAKMQGTTVNYYFTSTEGEG